MKLDRDGMFGENIDILGNNCSRKECVLDVSRSVILVNVIGIFQAQVRAISAVT